MSNRETEQSTFQALNDDNGAVFGPPAALVFGFERSEGSRLERLLHRTGAGDHRVVCCTTTMVNLPVGEALLGADGGPLLTAGTVPRVVLLSGLSDRQVGAVLDQYASLALPRPIFAVATEGNLGFTVLGLLEELIAEKKGVGGR